jgi:DnaJ-class molecular chaperone
MELLSPDGYYKYLGISKKTSPTGGAGDFVDQDLVKKNYRKLSLKHHPDKRGGDSETFRVLNRAQKVLLHPKLRQQYDILGLDLDDDDADVADNGVQGSEVDPNAQSTTQGIVHEVASMALTGVLQLGVKTSKYEKGF